MTLKYKQNYKSLKHYW